MESEISKDWRVRMNLKGPGVIARRSMENLVWRLRRKSVPRNRDGTVNLHLGCGGKDYPGFINIDLLPFPHVHYLRAVDDLAPFGDGSVDLIYCSHCLEHFPFSDTRRVLSEWWRVLRPGRVLRLSVPDFDAAIDAYVVSGGDLSVVERALIGGQDYAYNFHYALFNRRSLGAALVETGFSDVRQWCPEGPGFEYVDDWSKREYPLAQKKIPISLNLEAYK